MYRNSPTYALSSYAISSSRYFNKSKKINNFFLKGAAFFLGEMKAQ
jgi:hypothetical protein